MHINNCQDSEHGIHAADMFIHYLNLPLLQFRFITPLDTRIKRTAPTKRRPKITAATVGPVGNSESDDKKFMLLSECNWMWCTADSTSNKQSNNICECFQKSNIMWRLKPPGCDFRNVSNIQLAQSWPDGHVLVSFIFLRLAVHQYAACLNLLYFQLWHMTLTLLLLRSESMWQSVYNQGFLQPELRLRLCLTCHERSCILWWSSLEIC